MEDEHYTISIQEVDVFNDASDPLDLNLVHYPTAGIPDGFYHIKRAFLKDDATDLLTLAKNGIWMSSEQRSYMIGQSRKTRSPSLPGWIQLRSMTLMQEKKPRTRSYLAK
jgi:hypothetical protein